MGMSGWDRKVLRSPPILEGYSLQKGMAELSVAPQERPGGFIPMLGGGAVYQSTPARIHAPLSLGSREMSIQMQGSIEEDWHRWRQAEDLSSRRPVELFLELPITDMWAIPAAVKTSWTLSRWTPYGLVTEVEYPARVVIRAADGTETALTKAASSPPGAGEWFVGSGEQSIIETADISADAGGLLLMTYHPLRKVSVEGVDQTIPTPNGLEFSVRVVDHPPSREYL